MLSWWFLLLVPSAICSSLSPIGDLGGSPNVCWEDRLSWGGTGRGLVLMGLALGCSPSEDELTETDIRGCTLLVSLDWVCMYVDVGCCCVL